MRRISIAATAAFACGFALNALVRSTTPADAAPGSASPSDFSGVGRARRAERRPCAEPPLAAARRPRAGRADGHDDSAGSGFVWTSDGWIVTNRHVVEGARVLLVDVRGSRMVAREPARHRPDRRRRRPQDRRDRTACRSSVGNPRALRVGQWVLAAGSPYRLPRSFSVGIVSGLERSDVGVNPEGYEDFIQTRRRREPRELRRSAPRRGRARRRPRHRDPVADRRQPGHRVRRPDRRRRGRGRATARHGSRGPHDARRRASARFRRSRRSTCPEAPVSRSRASSRTHRRTAPDSARAT